MNFLNMVQAAPEVSDRGKRKSAAEVLRTLRENALAIYRAEDFSRDVIERKFLWRKTYFVNHPDAVKHILLDNASNYQKAELGRRLLEPGLGRGMLTSEGEIWRRHRKIMSPYFDHNSIVTYFPVIADVSNDIVESWRSLPDGAEVDIAATMMHASLQIICRAMFSSDSDAMVDMVDRGIALYQNTVRPGLSDMLGFPAWFSNLFKQNVPDVFVEFDEAIARLISARTAIGSGSHSDLLGRLVAAIDGENGATLSAKEVRDEVVTTLVAGHETTAQALTWTWYLLSQNPNAEAQLTNELDTVLGARPLRFEDLSNLPWTRMIIEEAMRLYPPLHAIPRQPIADDVVMGKQIRRGSTVLVVPWLLHRNPTIWSEPEVFNPMRFSPQQSGERSRFSYIPFGTGPRVCLGARLALTETMVILATLARQYRLHLKPDHVVEAQGLLTTRPKNGMVMIMARRKAP
ncbi:cytochrome P450 [Bradyrhizobium sp. Leaf401]|uniref:cytochrome P450 n=1 Tax=Bradyrhizobium sp. Leaf401 TaxID=2876564 RepID=UPI001E3973CB|nr:cytochrome P450 [Bradyrhizobium sp. Leaf401]